MTIYQITNTTSGELLGFCLAEDERASYLASTLAALRLDVEVSPVDRFDLGACPHCGGEHYTYSLGHMICDECLRPHGS